MKNLLNVAKLIGVVGSLTFLTPQTWAAEVSDGVFIVDKDHSSLGFEIGHLMISEVEGRFDSFDGTVSLKNNRIESIEGFALAKSINTNQAKRDAHLRGEDFFNAAKFPKLEFLATNLDLAEGKKKKIKGKLTILGVTKNEEIELEYKGRTKDAWGNDKIVLEAECTIQRKDYGLTYNKVLDAGGVALSDEVELEVKVQANLKK